MTIVAKTGALQPGAMMVADVNGERVAIANVEGTIFAFSDTCTHRGCSLAEGTIESKVVTCPCHGGQYDVTTGEVVGGPPPEDLKTYAVRQEGEDLVIG